MEENNKSRIPGDQNQDQNGRDQGNLDQQARGSESRQDEFQKVTVDDAESKKSQEDLKTNRRRTQPFDRESGGVL